MQSTIPGYVYGSDERVEALPQARFNTVTMTLQVTLWVRPYVRDGDW